MDFFWSQNNGVIAVISSEHAPMHRKISDAGGDPTRVGVRVFTFTSAERIKELGEKSHFTGTYDDLYYALKMGGHRLINSKGPSWGGYVPFSNAYETGIHGEQAQKDELVYKTTLTDILDVFFGRVPDAIALPPLALLGGIA